MVRSWWRTLRFYRPITQPKIYRRRCLPVTIFLGRLYAAIEHANTVHSIALSPDDDCIATGEIKGKITLRGLRDILPTRTSQ